MGSRMKSQLAMLSTIGLASVTLSGGFLPETSTQYDPSYDDLPKPIEPKPPGDTKQYFFNIHGVHSTDKMLKSECVFMCYARNDKNAERKFNNWKKNQSPNEAKNSR